MNAGKQHSSKRWRVAIMGTLLQLALGSIYAWSFFQQPIMELGKWTNVEVAWAFSLAIFFLGLAAAWGGINLDRFGPRTLAMTGGVLFSLGYFIASIALYIKSLPLLYVGYGLINGIGLGLGYVTPVATSAKWFPDKKGFITGMVVMGFGFGALIMTKVLAPIFMFVTHGDLVTVFFYIGVIMLFITLPAGYCLVNPPPTFPLNKGIRHSGGNEQQVQADIHNARRYVLSRTFLVMWTVFFCNIIVGIMFIGFQSPMLQDILKSTMAQTTLSDSKITAGLAASGATLIAASSICNGMGRFVWGGLSDKIGRVQTFRWILGTQLGVFIALIFVSDPLVFSILVCYILLCYGGGFGSMPSFVLDVFGPKLMPFLYGTILTAWGLGGIIGPQIVAFLKDNFGRQAAQYTFGCAAGFLLCGLIIAFALDNGKFAHPEDSRTVGPAAREGKIKL